MEWEIRVASGIKYSNYFEYIIQKHETLTENLPIRIYINRIENRVTWEKWIVTVMENNTPELWADANIAVQKTGKETEAGLNSIIKITTKDPQKMKWCQ